MNKVNKYQTRNPIGSFTPSLILYGEDVMNFCRRTKYNIQNLSHLFNMCVDIYRHTVNTVKSTIYTNFISHHMLLVISETLGFSIINISFVCLSIPNFIDKVKATQSLLIAGRIKPQLSASKPYLVSTTSRNKLFKSIIQSMLDYGFVEYSWHDSLLKEIDKWIIYYILEGGFIK